MLIISTQNNKSLLATHSIVANKLFYYEENDHAIIRRMEALATEAAKHAEATGRNERLECYIVFENATSLWLLQTIGISPEIEKWLDVLATTKEDLMAKSIFLKLPKLASPFPPLDRVPISKDSQTRVHLVLVGNSALTEAMALNAALVAHYPNYCKDTRLRTRITIIDEQVWQLKDELIQRYVHLFEHSYYRTLDLSDEHPQCLLHRPLYEQKRKDFVDVEWEFVKGTVRSEAVRQKLTEWSTDNQQVLTIIFSHDQQDRNYNEVFSLPQAIYDTSIPVLCYTDESDILRIASQEASYKSVYAFGKDTCNIDLLTSLRGMAQRVNYVYNHCFSLAPSDPITAPSTIHTEQLEELWQRVGSLTKQYSNIFNAMTMATKMHSLGHTSDDWQTYYALTAEEIDILTEVEHNRWNVEELILGYRPTNDEEQKMVEEDIAQKKILRKRKIHYDIRAYDDLRTDATGKNANVYDQALTQGIPLIIKSCITD